MSRKKSKAKSKGKRRKSKGTVFGNLDKLGRELDRDINKVADDAGKGIFGAADSFGKLAG